MNSEFREQIYNELNLRETEDLLEIWQTNDHEEWSDAAFEVIRQILIQRLGEIPSQEETIPEPEEDTINAEGNDYKEVELKIIQDANPPDFYNPREVMKVSKWIEWAAKAMVVVIILYNLIRFPDFKIMVRSYFLQSPNSAIVWIVAFLFMLVNAAIGVGIQYFILRTLAHILRILMEMEFRSRKRI